MLWFRNPDVYLVVDGDILGQCATQIGEPVHHIQSLASACDVRFNVRVPWCRLMQYFSLLCADSEAEVCASGGKLSTMLCMSASESALVSVGGAVIGKKEVPDDVCHHLAGFLPETSLQTGSSLGCAGRGKTMGGGGGGGGLSCSFLGSWSTFGPYRHTALTCSSKKL